ncbi:DUF3105 domain-containing protein [Paenibacillus sp. GCM10012307]|uniref:DUF3105 domain-containing protein n=1 Tax=Paenibacillus roseus TaxID=2798579 RepID=A0A934MJU4_9BACL|nr:DUF3105 domain-containing protein [Paenibacillus roseus]MBJ6360295.1 DUF3105 domain-containing protein [Paenibacillus roseus]
MGYSSENGLNMDSGLASASIWLYLTIVLLIAALALYFYSAKVNQSQTGNLKKQERAELRKKFKRFRLLAHSAALLTFVFGIVVLFKATAGPDIETLNFNVPIQVSEDKDYGAEHTNDPVKYELKIPTSGTHSPHDLKFGFYKEKPANELLVHNLEHGDIVIYYRPDADETVLKEMEYWAEFTRGGSGVLTVPNSEIPEGDQLVATAWTKTMELKDRDQQKIGTFIYKYMNKGPETIPPQVRKGGGTM